MRPVEQKWTERLKDIALQTWLEKRFEEGTSQEWVRVKYDSRIYAWAAEQLRQTAAAKEGRRPAGPAEPNWTLAGPLASGYWGWESWAAE